LVCRDIGHSWKWKKSDTRNSNGVVTRKLGCDRCPTTREDRVIASTGEVDARQYKYPKGYLFKSDPISRQELRSISVRVVAAALRRNT
jgi:hypothetical protein